MAPEMMELYIHNNSQDIDGYSYMVDWWSMGVTIYYLLTGNLPFCEGVSLDELLHNMKTQSVNRGNLSLTCYKFIVSLLQVNPEDRLGYGTKGLEDIRRDSFFSTFSWNNVVTKNAVPPIKPAFPMLNSHGILDLIRTDFEDIPFKVPPISLSMEKYFCNWSQTSTAALRQEFNLINEMKQYEKDTTFTKVLGDMQSTSTVDLIFRSRGGRSDEFVSFNTSSSDFSRPVSQRSSFNDGKKI